MTHALSQRASKVSDLCPQKNVIPSQSAHFQLPKEGKSPGENSKSKKEKKGGFDKKKNNIVSKRFPSIFKIKSKSNKDGKLVKGIPLGGNGKINFETDVQDDYFYRPIDKGSLEMKILGYTRGGQKRPASYF